MTGHNYMCAVDVATRRRLPPLPMLSFRTPAVSPAFRLSLAIAVALLTTLTAVLVATARPWLGLTLAPADASGLAGPVQIVRVASDGPAARAGVVPGVPLVAVGGGARATALAAGDLLEEPDVLDTWAETRAFFDKQHALARALSEPAVRVQIGVAGTDVVVRPLPRRPLGALPVLFWAQLAFGVVGAVMGAWVWALRPDDAGARAYAATGASMLVFTQAAAVYSTRELALPAPLFETLSRLNHLGALLFGAALCALFLSFPRAIARPRRSGLVTAAAVAWWLAYVAELAPNQDWGTRMPVILEMAGAIVLAVVQWWRARGDPAARALLRWSAVWVLGGCGLFVALTAVAGAAGWLPPIPQGYAFGFFVLMYAGLAVGLRRYRPFALDEWALRVLLWGGAVVGFVAFDAWLLSRFDATRDGGSAGGGAARTIALGAVLLLTYLPLRRWVFARLVRRDTLRPEDVFDQVLAVSYGDSAAERAARWRALVQRAFEPLQLTPAEAEAPNGVALRDDGATLLLPAVAGAGALRLAHPWGGRRLFAPRHVRLAEALVRHMRAADESRSAFERGVLGERTRIARDLHDAVSSPLLADLGGGARDEVRHAMRQLRTIVTGTDARPSTLAECLADVRYEAVERLGAHGLAVDWPAADDAAETIALSPAARHTLVAFHREVVTNVLKHARATRLVASVALDAATLAVALRDDGVGLDVGRARAGEGLDNLRARAAALGGGVTIGPAEGGGTVVRLAVSVDAMTAFTAFDAAPRRSEVA